MWSIEQREGAYILKKSGKTWASIISGVLLAPWILLAIGVVVAARPRLYVFLLVWAVFLVLPAWIIWRTLGQTQRRRIAAVVGTQDVMGGTVITLMDDKNERHVIVTTLSIAGAITTAVSSVDGGRASVTRPPLPPAEAKPADWYPDPEGKARLRYWDGAKWTEHTAP